MPEVAETPPPSEPRRSWAIVSPGGVLAILAFINFFNYVDRKIVAPLGILLQKPPAEGGLGLTDFEFGLLSTAFMIVHSLASVPLGILADRYARRVLIALGVGVWSLATAGAGFTRTFTQLFLARASVGIGEATYAPAASALISERFSHGMRARALGIFQLGMLLGGAVGMVVGGYVGGRWGWRAAFFVVGLPGLLLAGVALLIREPTRSRPAPGTVPPGAAEMPSMSLAMDARELLRSPSLIWINLAGICLTFFSGALLDWSTTFILRYHYDSNEAYLGQVTLAFGLPATLGGVLGTLTGSFLADRLEKRRPGQGRLLVIAIGTFASIPFAVAGFYAESNVMLYTMLGLGVFFNVWYIGPILAALHDVVPAKYRGTATGAYFLFIHLLGDAISPPIVGKIAQETGSLRLGLLGATAVLVLGGIAALLAMPGSARVAKSKRPT